MRALGIQRYADYADRIDRDPDEFARFLNALTINVTKFFRNADVWRILQRAYLPDLMGRADGPLRCWSAGCSSGEEAYTVAILASEGGSRFDPPAEVDATDLDPQALEVARRGTYRPVALTEMPPTLRDRHFRPGENGTWTVADHVRRMVRFSRTNLLSGPPPDRSYHLVVCRNVLIYFDRATQEWLLDRIAGAVEPGGVLVLGAVESLVGAAAGSFDLCEVRQRIYVRVS